MSTLMQLKSALADALARFNELDAAFHAGAMTQGRGARAGPTGGSCRGLQDQITTAERNARIANIGATTVPWSAEYGPAIGTDLASGLLQAGWSRTGQNAVTVDVRLATDGAGVRLKAGSVDGGVDGTEVRRSLHRTGARHRLALLISAGQELRASPATQRACSATGRSPGRSGHRRT